MAGGITQRPIIFGSSQLLLWISGSWLCGIQFFEKKQRLTAKIGISVKQQIGLRVILGKESQVIKTNLHSKNFATRYNTTKLLHTIYDGYRVPWTQLIQSKFKNKHTHLRKKSADHRRDIKDIGSTSRLTKAENNIRRGNKYILHKTWWNTKWKRNAINRPDFKKKLREGNNRLTHGTETKSGTKNITKKGIRKKGKHTHLVGNDKRGEHDREKEGINRSYCYKRRDSIDDVNIRREKQRKQGKRDNTSEPRHNIPVVPLHRMENDEGGERSACDRMTGRR